MSVEEKFIRALHAHRRGQNRLHPRMEGGHEIFQSSTLNSLLKGIYDGRLTFRELAAHGDFGLGTFNALDGEMIAWNGKFYQIQSSGAAHPVNSKWKTPFSLVTFFKPEVRFTVDDPITEKEFARYLDRAVPSTNLFYAVKIEGFFDSVKARSVPKQKKPYRPLKEIVKEQAFFEFHRVRGILVGFRFPDYTEGMNAPGYHLHFMTEDCSAGGHALACRMRGVTIEIDHTADLHLEMPQHGDFLKAELAENGAEAIRKIEK